MITINDLEKAHQYKRGANLYDSPMKILENFFKNTEDIVDEYKIKVATPSEMAADTEKHDDSEEVTEYITFSRVNVEAILKPEFQLVNNSENYNKVIGVVYALDVQNPVLKLYNAYERSACLNLAVFNPNDIKTLHFNDINFSSIFDNIPLFLENIEQEKILFGNKLDFLHNSSYSGKELDEVLGRLAVKCIHQNAGMTTAYSNLIKFIKSSQSLGDIKNIYYNKDGNYSPFTLYNALTATLSNKTDMTKRPDLVYKAYNMFSSN